MDNLTQVSIKLFQNKLSKLFQPLQQLANPLGKNPDYNTQEKVVSEAIKSISLFYKQLSKPLYSPVIIYPDSPPIADDFNNNFTFINNDLEILFNEFENLETITLGEFNYMVSKLNRLNSRLKSVSSQLGDYILFTNTPTKDSIYFSDSFNNINRIDFNSKLINTEQCEINQIEGVITLPVDKSKQIPINIINTPIINSNSNGSIGNNEELGASLNNNINTILDNNSDTWFEYERVLTVDDNKPLILDLTIDIGEEKIINFLRVNPNNFGTRTSVEILDINTSTNGKDFISIKDEIPIANFLGQDEDNIFILAPSTSKFAGQGFYTFTPRKAKYINLVLKQSTSYIINTTLGLQKTRYAIGLRDIELQAIPYKTSGDLISIEYNSLDEIKKIALLSNQNPISSSLVSIEHFLSPDNGISWNQIRPLVTTGDANTTQSITELIDYNGVSTNTIVTNNPVFNIRYRCTLKRNTEAFTKENEELLQEKGNNTEIHTVPSTTPFSIKLQKTPIINSIKLLDPQLGSRGKEDTKYNITVGNGGKLIVNLPFKPLKREYEKWLDSGIYKLREINPETIYVNGEEWTRGPLTSTNKNYKLLNDDGKLEFGNGTNGAVVPSGSIISMTLSEEQLFPIKGTNHLAKLRYPTSPDKGQIELYIKYPKEKITMLLNKGSKRHELKRNIIDTSVVISDSTIFTSPSQPFIDGSSELSGSNQYSLDYTNGILYNYTYSKTTSDTTITFEYYPEEYIDQYEFYNLENGVIDSINIDDNKFITFEADTLDVTPSVKYFNLEHLGVVQGTVSFKNSSGAIPSVLSKEVPFINGHDELLNVINIVEELDDITGIITATTINFDLKSRITTDTIYNATFSNTTIFKELQDTVGEIADVGDYFINRTTNKVYVRVDSNSTDVGTVSYYYTNNQITSAGRYSINYETGEVYSFDTTTSSLYADYEYTKYFIKYNIARLINSDDYEYKNTTNEVIIKDREILKNINIPKNSLNKYYQVIYQYIKSSRVEDINVLEPFFTPILKDYALKVITKSKLIAGNL